MQVTSVARGLRYSQTMPRTDARAQALENQRGIYAMLTAMALFLINDTLVKLVSGSLPTGQLICLRGLLASLWLLGICLHKGAFRQMAGLSDQIGRAHV